MKGNEWKLWFTSLIWSLSYKLHKGNEDDIKLLGNWEQWQQNLAIYEPAVIFKIYVILIHFYCILAVTLTLQGQCVQAVNVLTKIDWHVFLLTIFRYIFLDLKMFQFGCCCFSVHLEDV